MPYRFSAIALIAVLLSGCATYRWVHPSKDDAAFQQDSYQCKKEAAQTYPTKIVQEVIEEGHYTESRQDCVNIGNSVSCTSKPGQWVAPRVRSTDVNEDKRNDMYRSCMAAQGWRQIQVD